MLANVTSQMDGLQDRHLRQTSRLSANMCTPPVPPASSAQQTHTPGGLASGGPGPACIYSGPPRGCMLRNTLKYLSKGPLRSIRDPYSEEHNCPVQSGRLLTLRRVSDDCQQAGSCEMLVG